MVTRWNRQGIAWRQMSTEEHLWLFYQELLEDVAKNRPSQMRRLLIRMGDVDTLRAWDAERMKDTMGD